MSETSESAPLSFVSMPKSPPASPQITATRPLATTESTISAELPLATPTIAPSDSSFKHTDLQNLLNEPVESTNTAPGHIASKPSLGSIGSHQSGNTAAFSDARSNRTTPSRPLSSTFEDQRHEGKRGLSITSKTKIWEPGLPPRDSLQSEVTQETGSTTLVDGWGSRSVGPWNGKEEATASAKPVVSEDRTAEEHSQLVNGEKDENVYPEPLPLSILIIGIALSVFLISLDRTIITTAIPFITNEFKSYDDIGWYGSSYLLTASAFQPLYGRIFMLFNMKWSYLTALGMFELGSLICGVAPNSVTLIIGRAIAGLGSAGILTGSFVIVSHAVPLAQRPVLTAVIGLMFGVGATAGPLLGGVFTDFVTWRWCFYFNLPVGGATVAAMVFFFRPPKKHALMDKSFIYRIMELDLIGNAFLLGAAIMLFLALQFTEQRVPWGSAEIIGLLTGCGVTFIVFCIWQWWKADGALMPPRILGQRSVATACAMSFCIYSAILIHTYYLPMWFQAVKGNSAVHSGVNMIPYVAANAILSLLAGIFVSKNGYFTAPAIVGCAIGAVGCGFLSTINGNTSSSRWIGYEILASAGIGMAIQQGFTAVQIVLPLDEVAIGTAAVVAFQSLGGAIFVSVGNTILQNTLRNAGRNDMLPGVDIQAVIDAGAAEFRNKVTAEQLPALLVVYNKALQKVFIAAIPMAGLAMISSLFFEWRNVKDNRKSGDEEAIKLKEERRKTESMILDASRRSATSTREGATHLKK